MTSPKQPHDTPRFSKAVDVTPYLFPAERNPHAGTIMAWPTKASVYGEDIHETRKEIASIASPIARYEPLHLFTLEEANSVATALELLGDNENVFIHPITSLDSLWVRDTGPVFVRSREGGGVSGAVLNFNNWGNKLEFTGDFKAASLILRDMDVPAISASFVSEGGALELDGEGTLMATESSILNENRNAGKSREEIEDELCRIFGVTKTIWLKGVKGHDVTDCHVDALARFVAPGLVVLSHPSPSHPEAEKDVFEETKMKLLSETDAKGRALEIVEIPAPEYAQFEHEPCVSYVNYYVVNGAIIAPKFGDEKADERAKGILRELFPDRVIEQVMLRQLPVQGGGIHCATQQIPSQRFAY